LTDAPRDRFWNAIARRYDRVYAPPRDESRTRMARVLRELAPKSRVLDLGVGTGRELAALLDAGHSVVGMDVSKEMLAICARRARPIPLALGDLWERMPWDDASFDAILALHGTLSHPPSQAALGALPREVARLLRPLGVFFAEVPTLDWLARAAARDQTGIARVGERRARYVDDATGASIEAWVLSEDEWRTLLSPAFAMRIEPIGEDELALIGRTA
jgi:SAM-dependent methyltransferase